MEADNKEKISTKTINPLWNVLMLLSAVIFIGGLGFWFTRDIYQFFSRHMLATRAFLIWAVFYSVWLATPEPTEKMDSDNAKLFRAVMMVALIFAGFACFMTGDKFRDYLGHNYVAGYEVIYVPDIDDEGHPIESAQWHSASWLGSTFLYLSEWFSILLPLASALGWWHFSSRIVDSAFYREEMRRIEYQKNAGVADEE